MNLLILLQWVFLAAGAVLTTLVWFPVISEMPEVTLWGLWPYVVFFGIAYKLHYEVKRTRRLVPWPACIAAFLMLSFPLASAVIGVGNTGWEGVMLFIGSVVLMATALLVFSIGLLIVWLTTRGQVERQGPHCQNCGYLLIGLTEPRCPECGEPFRRKLSH